MKTYIYNISLFILFLFVSTACNDYLDKAPDERLSINSLDKVEATIVGAYQNSRGVRFTHWSTDNATLAQNVYDVDPIIEDLYTWSRDFRNQTHQDSPSAYWVAAYQSIANANLALEALEAISVSKKDMPKAQALKGEALVIRSYCHFMLVNIFAKHYNTSTSSEDKGVPYLEEVEKELSVRYERESVETVYEMAEKDLIEGIKLMQENRNEVNKNKYRFTFPSAYTYAARFYTYRNRDTNDIKNSLSYANKAIDAFGGPDVMRTWSDYLTDTYGPIDIYNQEVGMVQSSSTWLLGNWQYHLTTEIRDNELFRNPFQKNDIRFSSFWLMSGNLFIPQAYMIFRQGGAASTAYDLFPLSEAILLKAEAAIRQKDFNTAKKMMEYIGKNVYQNYNSSDLTTQRLQSFYFTSSASKAWLAYLLFERRNMFLFKGQRWFDIKRYELDVEHLLSNGTKVRLSKVAPNMDYQIPNFAITSGIEPNE